MSGGIGVVDTEVRPESDGTYTLRVNGRDMVERESMAVIDSIRSYLDGTVADDASECCQVARSIRLYFESAAL